MLQGACLCGAVRFQLTEPPGAPVACQLERHIFVAEKGDYYALADGLPQNDH